MNKSAAPKLRFPEFLDSGEWEQKTLDEICNFTRGPFGGSLKKDIFVKSGYAVYEQSHAIYQNFDSFRYYISKEKFDEMKRFAVHPDDIIMSCSGTMGKFAVVPKDAKSGVINQALLKLTVKKGFDISFIKVVLELPSTQENLLSQSAGGAIKNVVSVGQIKELNLYIPSLPEQQKIADCLSALDGLIAAQSEKVAALQTYKKGLMQNLFPAEGESVPRLRFGEFLSAGGWGEEKLGNISFFVNERISLDKLTLENYISTENILPDYMGVTRATKLPPSGSAIQFKVNDILISNIRPYLKKVWLSNKDGGASNDVIVVRAKEKVTAQYLSSMLINDAFIEYVMKGAKGLKMPRGDVSLMKEYPLAYPSIEEQQRIAELLGAVDEEVHAQGDVLAGLRAHKKGLMQQLFANQTSEVFKTSEV